MAFITIPSSSIVAGEPTSQTLFTLIKDDLDDLNSRLAVTEAATNIFRPIQWDVVGYYGSTLVQDGLFYDVIRFDITVQNVILFIWTAGSSGSTTIDIEYKRGVGAFTTILSSPISAASGSGNLFQANATLAVTSLLTGDFIRVNVDAAQVSGNGFSVLMEYEVA